MIELPVPAVSTPELAKKADCHDCHGEHIEFERVYGEWCWYCFRCRQAFQPDDVK